MKKLSTNRLLIACIALSALLVIVNTYAYFHMISSINNKFQVSEAKVYINEKFNPNDNWLPGEEKQKEVRFGNDGKIAAVLRVKFTTTAPSEVRLNFADGFSNEWEKHGDWYYYRQVLNPSQLTNITLKSVTISDDIGNDEHKISTDYSGVIFDVKVDSELLQASLSKEIAEQHHWDVIPTVTGTQVQWKAN